jgi:hypothetical protein
MSNGLGGRAIVSITPTAIDEIEYRYDASAGWLARSSTLIPGQIVSVSEAGRATTIYVVTDLAGEDGWARVTAVTSRAEVA